MRISVKLSGGWSGLRTQRVVDTADMSASPAARIEQLMHALIGRPLAERPKRARDARTYVIAIEGDGSRHEAAVSEASDSADQQELLELLRAECPSLR